MSKFCKILSSALWLLACTAPAIVHADSLIPKNSELAIVDEARVVMTWACDHFIIDPYDWDVSTGCAPSDEKSLDYSKARDLFEKVITIESAIPLASRRYTRNAANALGSIYRDGLSVSVDYRQAARYFELAIEHGDTDYAMAELGWFYLHGWGVEQNLAQARQYLLQIENGYSGREYLIHIYTEGVIVEKDLAKAAEYRSCLREENLTCCFYAECTFDPVEEKWIGN